MIANLFEAQEQREVELAEPEPAEREQPEAAHSARASLELEAVLRAPALAFQAPVSQAARPLFLEALVQEAPV